MRQALRLLVLAVLDIAFFLLELLGKVLELLKRLNLFEMKPGPYAPYARGVSVIIPERANPGLLEESLGSVIEATRFIDEPFEVIVVVNGSDPVDYVHLKGRAEFEFVRWLFFKDPLWFSGAIREGLKVAKYDWVYLLNNDMTMDALALREVLQWRARHVFAVASQVEFKDSKRRREETGWTAYRYEGDRLEIFDALPPDQATVRGTFYAGGGASLFRKSVLIRLIGRSNPYQPFYWEDVEWGTIAWRKGFEVLFCPTSKVWHSHRATNLKFFSEEELNRIFKRNGYKFQLRNKLLGSKNHFGELLKLEWHPLLKLKDPRELAGLLWPRMRELFYPFKDFPLQYTWKKSYQKSFQAMGDKPTIIIVSPYVVYPPSHGGAVRLHRLINGITGVFNVVLLSDEVDAYSEKSEKYFHPLASVHLLGGRTEAPRSPGQRISRIISHSHTTLRDELEMLLECYGPALVQIEFVELSKLIELRRENIPWLITLHEVLFAEKEENSSAEDKYEMEWLKRFDAIITCCPEDAGLIKRENVFVIPNGADSETGRYVSSGSSSTILFVGPFRYPPNLEGIQKFLERVYPRLRVKIPNLELCIIGGPGASQIASRIESFRQKGVRVIDFVEDPRPFLERCALTINPLYGVRGSSIKLIESLASGRVCVSTKEGARAYLDSGLPSLITVDNVEDFVEPLEQLLLNASCRHAIERMPEAVWQNFSWKQSTEKLFAVYAKYLGMKRAPNGW